MRTSYPYVRTFPVGGPVFSVFLPRKGCLKSLGVKRELLGFTLEGVGADTRLNAPPALGAPFFADVGRVGREECCPMPAAHEFQLEVVAANVTHNALSTKQGKPLRSHVS